MAITSVLISGFFVHKLNQAVAETAFLKGFEDGKASTILSLKVQISTLKAGLATLVSVDEAINQQKDDELNRAISKLYHDGATSEESADLMKARKSQPWKSLKYRIIFDQEPELK